MIYAALFEDDDRHADKRARHMADHLSFLDRNNLTIISAGPLIDTADGSGAGGLWLVRAEDADQVRSLVEADPFWPTGLRKSVRILAWRQVFADGARTRPGAT